MPTSPTSRLLAAVQLVDLFFSLLCPLAYLWALGVQSSPILPTLVGLIIATYLLKLLVSSAAFALIGSPLQRWHHASTAGRATDDEIRAAASSAVAISTWPPIIQAIFFGGGYVLVTAIAQFTRHADDLPPNAMAGTGLLVVAVSLGSYVLYMPLTSWVLGPFISRVADEARTRKIVLQRRSASYSTRMLLICLGLGVAPTAWTSSLGYLFDARANSRDQERRAELYVSKIALDQLSGRERSKSEEFQPFTIVDGAIQGEGASRISVSKGALRERILALQFEKEPAPIIDKTSESVVALRRINDTTTVGAIAELKTENSPMFLLAMAFFFIVALSWAPMVAAFVTNAVARPVRQIAEATNRIVVDGNLSQKISQESWDDIGQLAENFGSLVTKLRDIPNSLQESVKSLRVAVDELGATTSDQGKMISRQAAALQEAQVTAQEIKQTSVMAAQKAESVLGLTAKAEDIGRSGTEAVEQSMNAVADIRTQMSEISRRVAATNERTRQISGITASVKDLADQSNMLALNAAIEAVRSGEHGKGFSVVAREIRNLADRSIESTNKIGEILSDVSEAIRVTVSISDSSSQRMETGLTQVKNSGENLKVLSAMVKENADAVRQIVAAVGQQHTGIAQLLVALTELSAMAPETLKRIETTNTAVKSIEAASATMSKLVNEYRL